MAWSRRSVLAGAGGTVLLHAAGASAQGSPAPRALRAMSFNVRLAIASDGPNNWPHRRTLAARTIAAADPDIIGTQELLKAQGDDLVAALPQYGWFGVDRRGGHGDEHMGLFYHRGRLRLERFGQFWLSDTPEVPGSISWGHPYPRMATWAVLRTIADGRALFAIDTHLPYKAEDEAAREKGAALLLERMAELAGTLPVVLMGDFNTTPDSATHALLTRALADAWEQAPVRRGPAATFHNFTGRADRRIDWILTRGLSAARVETLTRPAGARQVSDHFPLLATLDRPR